MRAFERWPGIEHLSRLDFEIKPLKNTVHFELKKLDDRSENMLNKLVKVIDDNSCLGEWGVRLCLVSSLMLLLLGSLQAAMIPLIVLIGSVVRFILDDKKVLKQPVQMTQSNEEMIEQMVFGKKTKGGKKKSFKEDLSKTETNPKEASNSGILEL